MSVDKKYINELLSESKKALSLGEVPIGSIIVKNGIIISKAHNLKEKAKNPCKHAEIIAIDKASKKLKDWRLNDCELYTTLFPCPMCAGAIQQARIKKIYYIKDSSNDSINDISLSILDNDFLNHRVVVEKIEYNDNILDDFFVNIRK